MASKRMFSKDVIDNDKFYALPFQSQLLYFHLGLNADVKGFIQPRKVIRLVGLRDDDLIPLIQRKFVIPFPSGVVVVTHWNIHNIIRDDRESQTIFQDEYKQLDTSGRTYGVLPNYSGSYPGLVLEDESENMALNLENTELQAYSGSTPAQIRLNEIKLSESKGGVEDSGESTHTPSSTSKEKLPKTLQALKVDRQKVIERLEVLYPDKDIEKAFNYFIEQMEIKNYHYKDHYQALCKWIREDNYKQFKKQILPSDRNYNY